MKKLINILKKLKKIGVIGIKQSFEDEGASFKDIETMRIITNAVKIDLNVIHFICDQSNDVIYENESEKISVLFVLVFVFTIFTC